MLGFQLKTYNRSQTGRISETEETQSFSASEVQDGFKCKESLDLEGGLKIVEVRS